ncbi:MAG: hypothetical protein ACXAC5_23325 [Promethearchaeota archaeon]|jgi:hypothetical protein
MKNKKFQYLIVLALLVMGLSSITITGHSNSTQIPFGGMSIKYDLEAWDNPPGMIIPCTFSYSSVANNDYRVTLTTEYGEASWNENGLTRECSLTIGQGPGVGDHSNLWIFTNSSIHDTVKIFVAFDGDHDFNITRSLIHNFGNFGSLGVWELEDSLGSLAWYSNTTGILLNGTFIWTASGGGWLTYEITDTNVISKIPAAILGFNILFLITTFSVGLIIVLVKLKVKKNRST